MPNIIEITDFAAPELDVYARLNENQLLNRHEPEKGLFIAESPKVVERALDAGYVPVSLLLERKHIAGQAKDLIARCEGIPVYTADFEVLTRLTDFQLTRGVLCAMHRPPLPSVEEVCAGARRKGGNGIRRGQVIPPAVQHAGGNVPRERVRPHIAEIRP